MSVHKSIGGPDSEMRLMLACFEHHNVACAQLCWADASKMKHKLFAQLVQMIAAE
jgi:hypothetical protein